MKIIPIFIPNAGCSYKCIYCDQHKITGTAKLPDISEIHNIVERNLKTISKKEDVEIAFFGGTFTLLPEMHQRKYLDAVFNYVKDKRVKGIRMSTHPEAVSEGAMKLFKNKGGRMVELGIQSLDRSVLKSAGREINFNKITKAVRCITRHKLHLGVQVMLGLPEDTIQKSILTAKRLIKLKPETVRIYPTVVIKGTRLAEIYKKGGYKPLNIKEAVEWSAKIADIFEKGNVKVIRIGLHTLEREGLKRNILAGPYHPAFGQMVRSRQMRDKIIAILGDKKIPNRSYIEISAPKEMFNVICGHRGEERRALEKMFGVGIVLRQGREKEIVDVKDVRKTIAVIDPSMPYEAKERLLKMGYYVQEIRIHKRLAKPISGHPDMMLFHCDNKVIYEPEAKEIAGLLMDNGYECVKGAAICSSRYPNDIIYNSCCLGGYIVRYNGPIERHIEKLKHKFIRANQGYVQCSIVKIDDKNIITSDKNIYDEVKKNRINALLVQAGHIKLPGYKTGFIGGASGVHKDKVFFIGALKYHSDGGIIRKFIKQAGKNIIELYNGPLYDAGTIFFFKPT